MTSSDGLPWAGRTLTDLIKRAPVVVLAICAAGVLGWTVSALALPTPLVVAWVSVGLLALICAWRWRWGLRLVLLYVTVEGFVANLLYPSVTAILFKDIMLAATYLGFFLEKRDHRLGGVVPRGLRLAIGAVVALCLLEAFNPRGVTDPWVALVGLRVLLFYIPLLFLGHALAREPGALHRMARLVVLASIPISLYGILQWFQGPQKVAQLGPGFARSVWVIGPEATQELIYRPTSTFNFVGHFGAYLFFVVLLAFAALHLPAGIRQRAVTAAAFGSAAVATVLAAQRTTWVLLPVAMVIIYSLTGSWRGIRSALPVIGVSLAAAALIGQQVLANRLPVLLTSLPHHFWVTTGARFESDFLSVDAVFGHGTGTALGAVRYVTGGEIPAPFESGWFTHFFMFGIWGLLVYAWLNGAVLVAGWRGATGLARAERSVAIAVWCYLLISAVLNGSMNYPPSNVYFWLFAGLLAGIRPARAAETGPRDLLADRTQARSVFGFRRGPGYA